MNKLVELKPRKREGAKRHFKYQAEKRQKFKYQAENYEISVYMAISKFMYLSVYLCPWTKLLKADWSMSSI